MSYVKEKTFPEKLCLIPFMGINIHPTGSWQLCSSSRKSIPLYSKGNMSSLWESKTLHEVREKMLNNQEASSHCSGCYEAEKQGIDSKRVRFNKKQLEFHGKDLCHQSVYGKPRKILYLDISFSNLCNLNCVMCNSQYSSSWFQMDQKAVSEGLTFRNAIHAQAWSINKELLDSIVDNHSQDLKQILIKGGEPFIDPACLYFLKKLSDCKKKNDSLIVYIQTNGTFLNSKIIQAIGDLNMEISFSVDGLGNHYKWIRGFSFDRVMKNFGNLKQIKNLKHTYFHYTVSAFNFHRLPEMIEFVIKKRNIFDKFRRLTFGVAHSRHFNFRVFHQTARAHTIRQIKKTVKTLNIESDCFDGLAPLLKELSLEKLDTVAINQFKKWLLFCNDMRNEKLQDIDKKFDWLLRKAL